MGSALAGSDLTRRRCLSASAGAVGVGLLAGCTGESADSDSGNAADAEGSYTVEMAPVGELGFDAPPERVTTYFPGYVDMCVALGVEDSLIAMAETSRYYDHHYDDLDGVGIDTESLEEIVLDTGIDREIFYELDSDLHLIDPEWLINNSFFGLERSDIEEIRERVAPFFSNTIFRRTDEWHDYPYYTLYEAFEKVARVYQRTSRYQELKAFHDEYVSSIQSRLPPADERPNALLTYGAGDEPESFYPYRLSDRGTNNKQWHDLGISDALADTGIEGLSTSDRGTIDYETMLEIDPDAILVRSDTVRTAAEFETTVLEFMRNHDVASDLTAVQEGRVIRGGPIYQGPINHLFSLEAAARDLFPEVFGDEELFDRTEVANIVTGNE